MKRRLGRIIPLLILGVILAVYLGGYACMRLRGDFVRNATYYTDADGRIVHTDRIHRGARRWGPTYYCLDKLYTPLQWVEAFAWRVCAACRDGGKVGVKDEPG